ncbi:hydantoinase/oxoprolinase family protein [Xylophilus rhododendri]|uniref:Hydantoinase/oxoprolinase family protein n=1 Tax=Xylophilus rhododendri TaxID=2697032 RepID=A0A857J5I7_9BURK|nr:hydantoinase/oxoprolinase family protein [Xylophilus rhododendri]QHI98493.1 hydantoinase/oxoprolinase family protein [Xylophilus rhododendri]
MDKHYWIGIDTGGTFTDLVLRDALDGRWVFHKVPTWTADPAKGILDGIAELLALAAVDAAEVDYVVLGTTKATNAVLEGAWAKTGLITTAGFEDILDIARQRRPHYFNLDMPKPVPPARRQDRHGVKGRIAFDGSEVDALDEAAITQAITALRASGVESVAVCFMHSYANPAHEQRALRMVRAQWPEAYVCASSEVMPEFREYERFITAAVNASLMPVMDRYLEKFEGGVKALGVTRPARVMQSNGGAVSAATVRKLPINTFFSGPAGGIMSTVEIGRQTGLKNLIAFDMGGTSTDVCLVKNGRPAMKHERPMGGLPVRAPSLDIHTIGAGGGSIAWIDDGGMLKVGPRSAGAYPGPAAYGRGGTQPTVTDANVFLGRLSPVSLLDGRMQVFPQNAQKALEEAVCGPVGYTPVDAAVGVIEIANVHMTGAVRVISVEQGEDPRDYALIAFGGAGPLHAVDVARSAGIGHVVVPPRPGLLSAQGLLQSAQRADMGVTCLLRAHASNVAAVNQAFDGLQARLADWLRDEGAEEGVEMHCDWTLEMRYAGQSSELAVAVAAPRLDAASLAALCQGFHEKHLSMFGYDMPGRDLEIAQARVAAVLDHHTRAPLEIAAGGTLADATTGTRPVWFAATGYVETPIVKRELLGADLRFQGPAVIEQMDTTTVVPPDAQVRVDPLGYLHITIVIETFESQSA